MSFFLSRMEHYGEVKFVTSNPSRWADLVPPPTEPEVTTPLSEAESWDEEVTAREVYIDKDSWDSEIRQRELRIGSH